MGGGWSCPRDLFIHYVPLGVCDRREINGVGHDHNPPQGGWTVGGLGAETEAEAEVEVADGEGGEASDDEWMVEDEQAQIAPDLVLSLATNAVRRCAPLLLRDRGCGGE